MKLFLKVFYSLVSVFLLSFTISYVTGASFGTIAIVAFLLSTAASFIPMPTGAMDVVLEVWARYIMERFWKDNAFLQNTFDDSDYVVQGRIVHIPQPGAKPAVQKNRTVFPATAVRRADTDVLYSLDEFTTDPTHIPNIDAIHLSYSKQDSVLGDHMAVLNEQVADELLVKWATNATSFHTLGGPNAGTVGPVTGQVGNRLGFHHKDLAKLMIQFNSNNVPKNDRFILIDDNMFEYFYDSMSDTVQKDFSRYMDAANGIIGKLHSFSIGTRSSVLASDSSDDVKAMGAALAATDNLCSLAWQKNTIARAIGTTQLFQRVNDPLYYGDIYSALVMAGGRVRRQDGLGVYMVTQGTPNA